MTEDPKKLSTATAKAAGIPPPAEKMEAEQAYLAVHPLIYGPPMPPAVAKAVNAVMGEVPKLDRTEKNTHGNYNFASIDDFLEALRPLCAEHGLIISQDEEAFELKQTQNKKGEPVTWLVVTFRYTLIHSSGETWAYRPTRTIMVNASMGPQSFGAAQSYSLKQYMRSLFQVATCEPEVDTDSQGDGRADFDRDRQEDLMADRVVKHTLRKDIATPAGAKVFALIDQFGTELLLETENVDDYAERLSALLEKMPNLAELEQLWDNNKDQVKSLPDSRAADVTALYDSKRAFFAEAAPQPQTALEAG